jgi:hypothetical protein
MAWKPGETGNPHGRKPTTQTLKAIAEELGKAISRTKELTNNRAMIAALWEAATTGQVKVNRRTLKLTGAEWIRVCELLFNRIDGLPKAQVELSNEDGNPFQFVFVERPAGGIAPHPDGVPTE